MPETNGVETFNKAAAAILDILYQSFPKPISLDVWNLKSGSKSKLLSISDGVSDKNVQDEIELYSHSLTFLIEQGFVTSSPTQENGLYTRTFERCRLSSKGFAALGKDEPIGSKKSIGTALHEAVRDGHYSPIKELLVALFGG